MKLQLYCACGAGIDADIFFVLEIPMTASFRAEHCGPDCAPCDEETALRAFESKRVIAIVELHPAIEEQIGFIEAEWSTGETRHFACNACGHPYADADGGAIRGANPSYPARCYEKTSNGRRCGGSILEVEAP